MRRSLLPVTLAVAALAAPTAAHAAWRAPVAVTTAAQDTSVLGLAAAADRPALLLDRRVSPGHDLLQLRTTSATGRLGAPTTVASSRNGFEGAGLFAGTSGDLVAGWLEIVNGSRRPVVATGPALADRQVLAPGPRSTQIISMAANRRGDAVVAFWRYKGSGFQVFAASRAAGRRFGAPQLVGQGHPGFPVAAMGADGSAAVGWIEDDGVHVAERAAGASAFAATATLPGSGQASGRPALATGEGRTVAAWAQGGRDDGSVVAAVRTAGQAAWGNPTALSAPGVRIPQNSAPTATLDGERTLVAWTQGVAHTVSHDRAALAVRAGGAWSAPLTRGVAAPAHIAQVALAAPTPGRLPLLVITTIRGGARGLQTATPRADGSLGPSRTLPLGGSRSELGAAPLVAQGVHRTWLSADRWDRRAHRDQVLLFGSTA